MDRKSFTTELKNKLSFLPSSELERTLLYYNEMISDRMDNGMSEQEAVEAVGSIDEIVESVKAEGNYNDAVDPAPKHRPFAKIMLIIATVALYFVLVWDIILSVAFCACAVGCLIASVIGGVTVGMPVFLIFIGITLILTALFLVTIPIASYIKFGIARTKEAIGG